MCSSSSVLLGPCAVKMMRPCSVTMIFGLEVEWKSGRFRLSIFSWSTKMISTRF